jgi:hypothetical protein
VFEPPQGRLFFKKQYLLGLIASIPFTLPLRPFVCVSAHPGADRPASAPAQFPNSTIATFLVPVMKSAIVLRPNSPWTSPGLSKIVRPMRSSWAL